MTNHREIQDQRTLCGAKRLQADSHCTRPAGWGTNHPGIGCCKHHGGSTRNHNKAAQIESAKRAIVKLALTADSPALEAIDPRDLLAFELGRSAIAADVLGGLVNQLGLDEQGRPGGSIYGELRHHTGTPTGEAKPHVLWVMWMAERSHLLRVAKEAAAAGVEARRIELEEGRARLIVERLRAAVADPELAFSPEVQQKVLRVLARHMRALG